MHSCIHFFLQNKQKLVKKIAGQCFLLNQRPHAKIELAHDLEEKKTPQIALHVALFLALYI